MKIDWIKFIILFFISLLSGLSIYFLCNDLVMNLLVGIISTMYFIITLCFGTCIKFETRGVDINVNILGTIAFIAGYFINLIFSFFVINVAMYVVVNGMMLFIYLGINYSLIQFCKKIK